MNKHLTIIFIFLIAFFLVGCKQDVTDSKGPFIGGSEGLSIEFVNLAPPTSFAGNTEVPLKLLLKNRGEVNVAPGVAKVNILGINYDDFGLSPDYKETVGNLYGKGDFTKEGGEQEIDFGKMKYTPELLRDESFSLMAQLCYAYKTHGRFDICIKSTVSEEGEEGICDVAGEKVTEGSVSSAPVQITSVKEEAKGDKVMFDLVIENKGIGRIFSDEVSCEELEGGIEAGLLRQEKENEITVEIKRPLGVTCVFRTGEESNKGLVKIDNNKGFASLRCRTDVEYTHVDKLWVDLTYKYRERTSKDIEIIP